MYKPKTDNEHVAREESIANEAKPELIEGNNNNNNILDPCLQRGF